jgi:hypothetical protein
MKPLKTVLIATLALAVSTFFLAGTQSGRALAASITSIFITNDASHPVPVQAQRDGLTHMRQPASAHVTLAARNPDSYGSAVLQQLGDDGRALTDAAHYDPLYGYKIPAGKVLVITDIVFNTASATPGFSMGLIVYVWGPGLVGPFNPLFSTYAPPSSTTNLSDRIALGSGLVVRGGRFIYLNTGFYGDGYLLGYLADDV